MRKWWSSVLCCVLASLWNCTEKWLAWSNGIPDIYLFKMQKTSGQRPLPCPWLANPSRQRWGRVDLLSVYAFQSWIAVSLCPVFEVSMAQERVNLGIPCVRLYLTAVSLHLTETTQISHVTAFTFKAFRHFLFFILAFHVILELLICVPYWLK